jgi:hypothetical protein
MIQTRQNCSTWRKTCLSTTLLTTNPPLICLEPNMGICCERLMTNCLRHGMASSTTQGTQVQIIDHKLKTWPLHNHVSKCLNNLAVNHRWQMETHNCTIYYRDVTLFTQHDPKQMPVTSSFTNKLTYFPLDFFF